MNAPLSPNWIYNIYVYCETIYKISKKIFDDNWSRFYGEQTFCHGYIFSRYLWGEGGILTINKGEKGHRDIKDD